MLAYVASPQDEIISPNVSVALDIFHKSLTSEEKEKPTHFDAGEARAEVSPPTVHTEEVQVMLSVQQ